MYPAWHQTSFSQSNVLHIIYIISQVQGTDFDLEVEYDLIALILNVRQCFYHVLKNVSLDDNSSTALVDITFIRKSFSCILNIVLGKMLPCG